MTQIKIFEYNGNNEADVNAWLAEHPNIEVKAITLQPMHDLYYYGAPQICNQWIATTVIYEEKEKPND